MAVPIIPIVLRYGIKKYGTKALKALNIGANVSYGIDTAKQIKEGKTDNLEALSTVSALKVKAPILKFYDIVTRDKRFGTSAKTKYYIMRKQKIDDRPDQTQTFVKKTPGTQATGAVRTYRKTETRSQIRDKMVPARSKIDKDTGEILNYGKMIKAKTLPGFKIEAGKVVKGSVNTSKTKQRAGDDVYLTREATKTKGDTRREIAQMQSLIRERLQDRKAQRDTTGTVVLNEKDGLVRKIYSTEAKKLGIKLKFATFPERSKKIRRIPEMQTAQKITGPKTFRSKEEKQRAIQQHASVIRYIKKGRTDKQDVAVLGFHEKKLPIRKRGQKFYSESTNETRTIKTGIIIDPKTKKQAIQTKTDIESGGEYDVPLFKTQQIKVRERRVIDQTPDKTITTARNVIGGAVRNLKAKGCSAKLLREKFINELKGR